MQRDQMGAFLEAFEVTAEHVTGHEWSGPSESFRYCSWKHSRRQNSLPTMSSGTYEDMKKAVLDRTGWSSEDHRQLL
ncbi:unnamed protein product [Merluccius merluccius]